MPGHLIREVAQSGSAPRSGRGGRWFESSLPDIAGISRLFYFSYRAALTSFSLMMFCRKRLGRLLHRDPQTSAVRYW